MLPQYVPALCLMVAAVSLFYLCVKWSMGSPLNLVVKLSLLGVAIWSFLAAITGSAGNGVFITAIILQGLCIFCLSREWVQVLLGMATAATLFGLLAFHGLVHF